MSKIILFILIAFMWLNVSCGDDNGIDSEVESEFEMCIDDPKDGLIAGGCRNIFAYKFLDTKEDISVVIDANPEIFTITNQCENYALPIEGITVSLQLSKKHPDSIYFNFCDDIVYENMAEPFEWPLKSGHLKIVANIDTVSVNSKDFRVSLELNEIVFNNPNSGKDTLINNIAFYKTHQGWEPPF
ncbi:hypothetical protein SAMN05421640_2420 [Ekhidna lutea]|uniref:Lipid-binding hydrolase n=1 Tax=Ekhidna lutea TaxID=447679 RepID=A0A239K654_EKHLU|nr:hypothetical protein [Ekhidna lutea]SNT13103.1 hypothetical protein SAMN05421640_2420 [Ekhidna lutea]